jgi:hypothetical protein
MVGGQVMKGEVAQLKLAMWAPMPPNPHLGSYGRTLQSIGCGLGGKSRVR